MAKYELLRQQLQYEGIMEPAQFFAPNAIEEHNLLRVHDSKYLNKLEAGSWSRQEERRSGFPWSLALIDREKTIMEGTRLCGIEAARGGIALNIAGGTHHAFKDRAEGFCLLNDLAITAYDLLDRGMDRIAIIDLDVHQGNGTAQITAQEDRIFTLSMHGEHNYPLHKPQSSLDIPLPDGTGDLDYLNRLDHALHRVMTEFQPQVVLYQCGVDVLATDKLGRLALTIEGCRTRDEMVFQACKDASIGVACAMGGGYSQNISTIVKAHMNTFKVARDIWT
ncbi:MAG: histone deacetylase [Flavobacteriales bacterium]|nr:histone deacetylase [Flavobacteriales bacterium]